MNIIKAILNRIRLRLPSSNGKTASHQSPNGQSENKPVIINITYFIFFNEQGKSFRWMPTLLTLCSVIIAILAWQYPYAPKSSEQIANNSASESEPALLTSDEGQTDSSLSVRYAQFLFNKSKYTRTVTLPDTGWVDTGIVLKRNQRIVVATNENSPSSNYWAVMLNREPDYNEDVASFTNRWSQGDGFSGEIDTNEILGDRQKDTLKMCAYWLNQGAVTVDVIVDYDSYLANMPEGEWCSY